MGSSTQPFDPYHGWLGIPPKDQPPNHYRLLGLWLFEDNTDVIRDAAERQAGHVRRNLNGEYHAVAEGVLRKIEDARRCLLQRDERHQYDDNLRSGEPLDLGEMDVFTASERQTVDENLQSETHFDAYYQWLGIRPEDQPPDHYRLLGIESHERDRKVIREAAERQIAHIRKYALGQNSELAQQLLVELGRTKAELLDALMSPPNDGGLDQDSFSHVAQTAPRIATSTPDDQSAPHTRQAHVRDPAQSGTSPHIHRDVEMRPEAVDRASNILEGNVRPEPRVQFEVNAQRFDHRRTSEPATGSGDSKPDTAAALAARKTAAASITPGLIYLLSFTTLVGTVIILRIQNDSTSLREPTAAVSTELIEGKVFEGHSESVNTIAISPDGSTAVSASSAGVLKLWELKTGTLARTLFGDQRVRQVAISQDGQIVVSLSANGTLTLWDLEVGEERRIRTGHVGNVHGTAITSDGRTAISCSSDRTVKVWSLEAELAPRTLSGHIGRVYGVAVAPDGMTLASWSREGEDNQLKVWDLPTGQARASMSITDRLGTVLASNGEVVISQSRDKSDSRLTVWDLTTGAERSILDAARQSRVVIAADGKLAISWFRKTLQIWDLQAGTERSTLTGNAPYVQGVAITHTGKAAISWSSKTLKVWDLETGTERRTLAAPPGVRGAAITPDGATVISWSSVTLQVWDLEAGTERTINTGYADSTRGVVLAPNGRTAVSWTYGGRSSVGTVKVWDLVKGRLLNAHVGTVGGIAITPDSRTGIGWFSSALRVWDLKAGAELRTASGTESVNGVVITSDATTAISRSSGTIKVWELDDLRTQRTLSGHSNHVLGVAMSADGKVAVSCSADQTLKIWDLEALTLRKTLSGHEGWVSGVAITPSGKTVISYSDETIKVWDSETGFERQTLKGHANTIYGVAVTPDGKTAVSCSADRSLRVWDVQSGECLTTFTDDNALTAVAVIGNGNAIIVGDESGSIRRFEIHRPTNHTAYK